VERHGKRADRPSWGVLGAVSGNPLGSVRFFIAALLKPPLHVDVRVRMVFDSPDGPTKGGKARAVYLTEEIRKFMIEHRRRLTEVALKKRWGQLRVN